MTDVPNRGSMLDRYPCLLFLSFGGLEFLHVSEWVCKCPKAYSSSTWNASHTASGQARLQKQPCMATGLVNLPFGIYLLNVYLSVILIMGPFFSSAVDL